MPTPGGAPSPLPGNPSIVMSWITIRPSWVKTRLSAPELDALSGSALADGQGDPLPHIIRQVVDEARGFIAACKSNRLGPSGTIPVRLRGACLAIIRLRLATRLPGMEALMDELRQREGEDATRLLRDVAACAFAIEDPSGDEASAPAPTPRIKARPRLFTRRQQDGI